MTTLTHSQIVTGRPYGLTSTLDDLRARYVKWRAYRRTLSELEDLSPRELDDLGLTQGALRRVARETVYGDET